MGYLLNVVFLDDLIFCNRNLFRNIWDLLTISMFTKTSLHHPNKGLLLQGLLIAIWILKNVSAYSPIETVIEVIVAMGRDYSTYAFSKTKVKLIFFIKEIFIVNNSHLLLLSHHGPKIIQLLKRVIHQQLFSGNRYCHQKFIIILIVSHLQLYAISRSSRIRRFLLWIYKSSCCCLLTFGGLLHWERVAAKWVSYYFSHVAHTASISNQVTAILILDLWTSLGHLEAILKYLRSLYLSDLSSSILWGIWFYLAAEGRMRTSRISCYY